MRIYIAALYFADHRGHFTVAKCVRNSMINARQELFARIFDQATRGGRGAAARAIDAAIADESATVETPLHRALGAIARGAADINAGHLRRSAARDHSGARRTRTQRLQQATGLAAHHGRLCRRHDGQSGTRSGMDGARGRGHRCHAASVDSFTAYSNHGCLLGMVGEHDASKDVLERALGSHPPPATREANTSRCRTFPMDC